VQLDLKLVDPEDPLPEVERGAADVAIVVRADSVPPSPGVRMVHLLDDPMRAVLPRGHRLAAKRVIDLADLAEDPWVCNERVPGTCLDVVIDACGAAGFSPNFAVTAEDYATAKGFVAAGLGVSLHRRRPSGCGGATGTASGTNPCHLCGRA
jgi:DNA-binding transcriptional LysR family regulator